VFDIDCVRSRDATDNWLWMSSRTLYLSIALPLNMVGGDLDFLTNGRQQVIIYCWAL